MSVRAVSVTREVCGRTRLCVTLMWNMNVINVIGARPQPTVSQITGDENILSDWLLALALVEIPRPVYDQHLGFNFNRKKTNYTTLTAITLLIDSRRSKNCGLNQVIVMVILVLLVMVRNFIEINTWLLLSSVFSCIFIQDWKVPINGTLIGFT